MEQRTSWSPLFRLIVTLCAVPGLTAADYVSPDLLIRGTNGADRQQAFAEKRMDRNMLLMGLGKRSGLDKHVLFQGLGKRNGLYVTDFGPNPYTFSKRRMSRGMLLAGIGKRMDRNMLFTGLGKRPMDRAMLIQGLGKRADHDFLLSNLDDGVAAGIERRQDPKMILMGIGKRSALLNSHPYAFMPDEDEFDLNPNFSDDDIQDYDLQERDLDNALRFGGLGKKRRRRSTAAVPSLEKDVSKRAADDSVLSEVQEVDGSKQKITAKKRGIDRAMLFSGMGKRDFTKRGMDRSMLFSGVGKRGFDRNMLFTGMGKRSDPKRVMDSQMLLAGLGKRPHDEDEDEDVDHTAIFNELADAMDRAESQKNASEDGNINTVDTAEDDRLKIPYDYIYDDDDNMNEKRYSTKMLLTGLGRRQDDASQDEFDKRGIDRSMLFSGVGKRRLSKMLLTGLGKRRLDSSMLFSGLGKRGYSKLLLTGLGKRRLDSSMLFSGLGKRRMDSSMLFSGLGKRRLSNQMLFSGLGKRETKQNVDNSKRQNDDQSAITSGSEKRTVS